MKNLKDMMRKLFIINLFVILTINIGFAGNKQRAGEAGATQLLVNPWAGAAGFANANMSSITGLEAIFLNVAGTAFVNKLDAGFSYSNYLAGSGMGILNFGFSTKAGEAGVLSATLTSFRFGEIPITTVESPDGTGATFTPSNNIVSVAYSRVFSNAIYGGAVLKVITESIGSAKATGVAIDAGIQYLAGARDQFRFGVTLQNVGPTMKYNGNGLSKRVMSVDGTSQIMIIPVNEFEMPSLLRVGASYDFELTEEHHLLAAGTFTSNSFTKDQFGLGLEYGFNNLLFVRGGYLYEENVFSSTERTTAFTGLSAGASLKVTLNKEKGNTVNIDYSYRHTNPFNGVHSIGIRISI